MDSDDKPTLATYLEDDDPPPACLDVARMGVCSRAWLENVFQQTAGDIMACEERCMGVLQVGMPWPWAAVDEANNPLVPVPAETVPATLVPAETVPATPVQPSVAASVEHVPPETVPAMPAQPSVAVEHVPAATMPVHPSVAALVEHVPPKTVPAMPAQPSEAASMEHAPAETVPAMPAWPMAADSVEHAPAKALQPGATDIVLPGHLAAAFAEFCKANPGGTQFVQAPA